jgi:o-succinylbenzoate synthase
MPLEIHYSKRSNREAMEAHWKEVRLTFKTPATTSRGTLREKLSYLLALENDQGGWGLGEASLLPGLSPDDGPDFPNHLNQLCQRLNNGEAPNPNELAHLPALDFALEMARLGLAADQSPIFPSPFTQGQRGLPINGLIWMADRRDMQRQIADKINQGFRCIKLKIGALDFASEYALLKQLRRQFNASQIEIRVDANGAFAPGDALERLKRLAELPLHSIKQPIPAGQPEQMAHLVQQTPLPIALDEELIGVHSHTAKLELLSQIRPHYLVLKPSLLGGLAHTQQWIDMARSLDIGWWITSALESNLGLNLLAQWVATLDNPLPQGLGTGLLYLNNLPSPLTIQSGYLHYNADFPASAAYRDFFERTPG